MRKLMGSLCKGLQIYDRLRCELNGYKVHHDELDGKLSLTFICSPFIVQPL